MSALPDSLVFTDTPLGLGTLHDAVIAAVPGAPGLFVIRDGGNSGIRLFVVDASHYVPLYSPKLSPDQLLTVGATDDEHVRVFVIATLTDDAPTANLLAPILINVVSGAAAQVILDDDWPLRAALTDYATA